MPGPEHTLRRIGLAAAAALTVGIGVTTLLTGFSGSWLVKLLQGVAIFGLGAVILGGAVALALVRLADWRDPESEADFEAIVLRAERLAAQDDWYRPREGSGTLEDWEGNDERDHDELFDPRDEEDFRTLVRSAVDDLPLEFHRALEHVA